jgi:hypothetical protein
MQQLGLDQIHLSASRTWFVLEGLNVPSLAGWFLDEVGDKEQAPYHKPQQLGLMHKPPVDEGRKPTPQHSGKSHQGR